jgi:D-isomer specific 2-hydroxyacid dehydrogenase, NAD binding domain
MRLLQSAIALLTLAGVDATAAESPQVRELIERYGLEESATPVREHPGWRKPRRMIVGGMASGALRSLREMTSEVEFIAPTTAVADVDAILGFCSSDLKRSAYFINVARGGSVVTAALVDALNKGQIAGAGLDVTDPEPLPADHPLWRAPNVIITPHISNDSELGIQARIEVLKENVRRYIAGDKLLSLVDVGRGY